MKLQEFVAETLAQIVSGVSDAQRGIGEANPDEPHGGRINPPLSTSAETLEAKGYRVDVYGLPVQNVEFDVAVTVNEEAEAKGGAGLMVAGIGLGAKAKVESRDTTVHHIKFAVPLTLPRDQGH